MLDNHWNKICEKCWKTYPDHMYHVCKIRDQFNNLPIKIVDGEKEQSWEEEVERIS